MNSRALGSSIVGGIGIAGYVWFKVINIEVFQVNPTK